MSDFNGFPNETIRFFEELKKNNTKAWFDAHRVNYEDGVKKPAEAFVVAMGAKLQQISPGINAVPKINKSLFRLNRDTRFSPDKRPYKTNMGIWFWEGGRKRMECSGFYFHLEDKRLMLGVGIHVFSKELIGLYRDAVIDKKLGPKLRKVLKAVSDQGYTIGRKHYKRVPRGYAASHKNAEYLLYKGLTSMIEADIPDEFHTKAFVGYVFSHFKNMSPIHKWLTEAIG
jgi:uncharacterized protein (TIGR02453 family)